MRESFNVNRIQGYVNKNSLAFTLKHGEVCIVDHDADAKLVIAETKDGEEVELPYSAIEFVDYLA